MRPRLKAAENSYHFHLERPQALASMRPRLKAAENASGPWRSLARADGLQ